jgi:hypothetical protein
MGATRAQGLPVVRSRERERGQGNGPLPGDCTPLEKRGLHQIQLAAERHAHPPPNGPLCSVWEETEGGEATAADDELDKLRGGAASAGDTLVGDTQPRVTHEELHYTNGDVYKVMGSAGCCAAKCCRPQRSVQDQGSAKPTARSSLQENGIALGNPITCLRPGLQPKSAAAFAAATPSGFCCHTRMHLQPISPENCTCAQACALTHMHMHAQVCTQTSARAHKHTHSSYSPPPPHSHTCICCGRARC